MRKSLIITLSFLIIFSCSQNQKESKSTYLDYSNRLDKLSGGVKVIPVKTPEGFNYFFLFTKSERI